MEEKTFTEYQVVCAADALQGDPEGTPEELSSSLPFLMFNAGAKALAEYLVDGCEDPMKKKRDAIFKAALDDMIRLAQKGREAEDRNIL